MYLSPQHFAIHKKNCKAIHKARTKLEVTWEGPQWENAEEEERERNSHPAHVDDYIQRSISYCIAIETIQMADLLLQIGYRESDTVEHGNVYYRNALKYYIMPISRVKEAQYYIKFGWVDDRILLLLVLLGGDYKSIETECVSFYSPRNYPLCQQHVEDYNALPINRCLHFSATRTCLWGRIDENGGTPRNPFANSIMGYEDNRDVTFQAIMLLSEMKSMANYRRGLEGERTVEEESNNNIDISRVFQRDEKPTEIQLRTRIKKVLFSIRYHNNESLLYSISEDIPLKPEHAPRLFRVSELTNCELAGDFGSDTPAPTELWMMYQDYFFETPGLMEVFEEFVVNEE